MIHIPKRSRNNPETHSTSICLVWKWFLDPVEVFWTYLEPSEPTAVGHQSPDAIWEPLGHPSPERLKSVSRNGMERNRTERNGREGKRREGNGMNERMSGIISGLIDEHMEERIDERAHALTNKWKPTLDKNYKTQAMDNNGKKTQHGVFNWSKHQKKHTQPPMVRKHIQQIEIFAISTTKTKESTKHTKHI